MTRCELSRTIIKGVSFHIRVNMRLPVDVLHAADAT